MDLLNAKTDSPEQIIAVPSRHLSVRLAGLDTLRFIAALWVAMSHGAVPPLTAGYDTHSPIARVVNGVYSGCFNGGAAVILFFLISGLCIHYPYSKGRLFHSPSFLMARLTRIMLPMLAASSLANVLGIGSGWDAGIPAWSLVAEIVYYFLYPVMRPLAARLSWKKLLLWAFAAALLLAFTKPMSNVVYPAWGYGLDWLLGLPCWLMGVCLAESFPKSLKLITRNQIWLYRLAALAVSALLHHLALQQILGSHLTLNFFAIQCYSWLHAEVCYFQQAKPPRILEYLGAASYSLYLIHITLFVVINRYLQLGYGSMADWLIVIVVLISFTLAFYHAVERPSHVAARRIQSALAAA